ncbi:hypothetical protein DFH06DRAFT_1481684, partial [Mycena polygramma]
MRRQAPAAAVCCLVALSVGSLADSLVFVSFGARILPSVGCSFRSSAAAVMDADSESASTQWPSRVVAPSCGTQTRCALGYCLRLFLAANRLVFELYRRCSRLRRLHKLAR